MDVCPSSFDTTSMDIPSRVAKLAGGDIPFRDAGKSTGACIEAERIEHRHVVIADRFEFKRQIERSPTCVTSAENWCTETADARGRPSLFPIGGGASTKVYETLTCVMACG